MKKSIAVIVIALIVLFCVLASLYVIDYIKMKNNEPVFFSTWGNDYVPPEGITAEEAIEYAKQALGAKSKETIRDFKNPDVEEVLLNKATSIYLFEEKTEIVGGKLYKITFSTTQDGLLGPIVFYINKLNGEVVGVDYRE